MIKNDNVTLVGQLLHWGREQPNAPFLVQPMPNGAVLSLHWAEVVDQVKRMACYLRSLSLPANSQIAILGKNSAHWIMADLSIMLAGYVSVPLYPTLDSDSINYILDHSESRLIFVGKMDVEGEEWEALERALPSALPKIALPLAPTMSDATCWNKVIASNDLIEPVVLPDADALATIIYTSGSTGVPKGVMHSNRSMLAVCEGFQGAFNMTPADRMLSYLPLAHAAERAIVETSSLYFGFCVFFSEGLASFADDLRRAQPTVFFSVPRLWLKFYSSVGQKLTSEQNALLETESPEADGLRKAILAKLGLQETRVALTGSAPISKDIVEWYRQLGLEMLDCYGMSENFATSHVSKPGQVRAGYVGSPAEGVEARISASGELQVKSPGQMLGYFKLPEKTQSEITEDGFFKTGDCGVIDYLGRLKITGRVKDIFKTSKGKYIAPVPIEQKFDGLAEFESVCVMGSGFPQPFALVSLGVEERRRYQDADLRGHFEKRVEKALLSINETLQAHEVISFIVIAEDIWSTGNGLLTPTMKIKRPMIENAYLDLAAEWFDLNNTIIWQY